MFISYAHESDALRASVKALADWLVQRGCRVLTDHAYIYRPPAPGWQTWMLGCIDQSDTVLVVCTPQLRACYEKTAVPDSRHGATYEGAIVTQQIYDAAMRNTKFQPILPDDGDEGDIPTFLKPWSNRHRFPGGNDGILRMIFDGKKDTGSAPPRLKGGAAAATAAWVSGADQERLASKLLGAPAALRFFESLQREFADEFALPSPPSAASMVQRFSASPEDQVDRLFLVVRRALLAVPPTDEPHVSRRAAEEAAAALYFVAACRLVDQAVRTASGGDYVLHVPRSERIVCAIISTALFGGEIRLVPSDEAELPASEYVFKVDVAACGDQIVEEFERAVFAVVMANDRDTPEVSKGSGPLHPDHAKRLAARLRSIRQVHRNSLSLVVHGLTQADACHGFATTYTVPVMLPASEATAALLGMDAGTLLAEIREFWSELEVLRRPVSPQHADTPSQSAKGEQSMPSSGLNLNISGGNASIAISTGDHSVSQTGSGNTAQVGHQEGSELAALLPLVQELLQAIAELSSPRARETLKTHAEVVAAGVARPEKSDPGRIKQALDAIKSGADMLDDGGRIIGLCNKAYQVLAPVLGLPPSPLP
ncbi:toll/interleukin-1 receptor domain-containing protein [Candidatus Accumulibacter vicinus]|uniref:toll/interleukin-1 receptor domain-containing protein n=1 Tax=Candidatus Accumulibacter vicinus TaxID=2954382 RepID=UPI0004AD6DC3|nr:toll/interleukin-1 receptor domain-containing protein [Candidatus Accumulibacter vicinus]